MKGAITSNTIFFIKKTSFFYKNKQKQSKIKNKFKMEKIEYSNPELKTARIVFTHGNTQGKIHLTNIKRLKQFKILKLMTNQSEQN